MSQNQQREDGDDAQRDDDDAQRDDVGEREEGGEDRTTERLIGQVAVVQAGVADASDRVGAEYRSVDEQHADPDDSQRGDDARPPSKSGSARVVDDRHVAYDGNQYQRVDRDVGGC